MLRLYSPLHLAYHASSHGGEGLSDLSIVFYRFSFSALVVGAMMLLTRRSFRLTRGELVTLTYLAFLSDGAALFLIDSYNYMSSGVATTLHFMYPVFTALLMMAFYHEARRASTLSAVAMAVVGVTVLVVEAKARAYRCAG